MDQIKFLDGIMRCTRCPDMCACCCPVFTRLKSQTVSPSNKAHAAQMLAAGLIEPGREAVEALFQCNNCRLCAEWCIYDDLVLGDLLSEARWQLFQGAPASVPDYAANLREVYQRAGTFSPPVHSGEDDAVRERLEGRISERGEILVIEGAYTRANAPEITLAALQILEKTGLNTIYMPEQEPPSGAEAYLLGLRDLAIQDSRRTVEFLQSVGADQVVALDPLCAYHLKFGLAEIGLDPFPAVRSFPAFLIEALDGIKDPFRELPGRKLVVDDDPVLVRYLGEADLPRQLLQSIPGVEIVQARPERELAEPAVSYSPLPDPEVETAISAHRADALRDSGGDTIITTSPRAKVQLSAAVQGTVQVIDLGELIYDVLN